MLLDLLYGLCWTVLLIHPAGVDVAANSLMMFLMLLVIAVSSMLAASLPIAALAATIPVTVAIALNFVLSGSLDNYVLAVLALAAEGYFALLAHRLHSTTLATLEARAEKDALIGELEQAKAISDEARHRAESANVAKSRFLAQMSHELRTPLNAILGFSEVMKSEIFGAHAVPVYKEYSADIHNSGVHLLNLINEILDLSRIEAGRYELNEEAVSLVHVVADCHHLLKLRATSRGITIHEVFEHGMPRIWADERAIRQVVLNLLSNAIKFTPQGGEIWLKAGWTASGGQYLSRQGHRLRHPEDEIPIVLASFGQGSNSIKSAEQGAGLGLPIAKSLIDMHGGTFTLKSKLRIGTEVIVTFPPERVMSALGADGRGSAATAARTRNPSIRRRQAAGAQQADHECRHRIVVEMLAQAGGPFHIPTMSKETPCIAVCMMDPRTNLCFGCGRTLPEIARWHRMETAERLAVMATLPARMADAGLAADASQRQTRLRGDFRRRRAVIRILLVLLMLAGTAGAVVAYGDPEQIARAGNRSPRCCASA